MQFLHNLSRMQVLLASLEACDAICSAMPRALQCLPMGLPLMRVGQGVVVRGWAPVRGELRFLIF